MENEKKNPLSELMHSAMEKVREMVDTNTIVGQPITTPDGVTLIPLALILPRFMGVMGIYRAEPIADFISVTTAATLFAITFKKVLREMD